MNFSGRVALITGGTRGIGLAIGRRLSDADARIAILARDPERLALVDQELGRADDAVIGLRADVTDPAQVEEAVAAVLDRWGRIDILVNNAGDVGRTVPTWELSDSDWLGTLAVNLTGSFYCLRAVLPVMRAQRYGRIVNVASIVGKEGAGKLAAYSAAKAGMIGLTKAVAKEVAPDGILVNCVTPAMTRTAMIEPLSEDIIRYSLTRIPLNRVAEPEEVAELVAWLASEACSFSTGAVFDISGGRATY
jgi:NAD(P)-dependent dehydrogenase (short-subunit alcohol dehydrogenase family)